jgi:hypothetical protein
LYIVLIFGYVFAVAVVVIVEAVAIVIELMEEMISAVEMCRL